MNAGKSAWQSQTLITGLGEPGDGRDRDGGNQRTIIASLKMDDEYGRNQAGGETGNRWTATKHRIASIDLPVIFPPFTIGANSPITYQRGL